MKNCVHVYAGAACAVLCAAIIFTSLTVFAYDGDYLDFDKWYGNDKVTTSTISKNTTFSNIEGVFRYYIDSDSKCLYVYLDVSDDSYIEHDSVQIGFEISNSREYYSFTVDKNGLCNCTEDTDDNFTVHQNFDTVSDCYRGRYVCAVEFGNQPDCNTVSVSFWNKGHKCLICENLIVNTLDETTAHNNSTGANTSSSKVKTTSGVNVNISSYGKSAGASTNAAGSSQRAVSQTGTKFYKYTQKTSVRNTANGEKTTLAQSKAGKAYSAVSQVTDADGNAVVQSDDTDYEDGQPADIADYTPLSSGKMTTGSKVMLAVSAVSAVSGVAMIAAAIARKQFSKKLNEKSEHIKHDIRDTDDDFDF